LKHGKDFACPTFEKMIAKSFLNNLMDASYHAHHFVTVSLEKIKERPMVNLSLSAQ